MRKSSAISGGGTIIWPPFIEITQSTTYRHIINNKQNCRNNSEPSPHLALFWWGGGKSSNQQPLFSGSIIHRAQAGKAENNIPRVRFLGWKIWNFRFSLLSGKIDTKIKHMDGKIWVKTMRFCKRISWCHHSPSLKNDFVSTRRTYGRTGWRRQDDARIDELFMQA